MRRQYVLIVSVLAGQFRLPQPWALPQMIVWSQAGLPSGFCFRTSLMPLLPDSDSGKSDSRASCT